MRQVLKIYFDRIKLKNKTYIDFIAYALCLVFIAAGILVSLNRYWQYEVFYYDFGIFDQAIWRASQLQPPIIDHLVVGGKWIFADHFSPSIFLLSPFYWIFQRSEMLLIAQAIIVGLSGIFLYKIGKKVIGNHFLSFSILVCYFLFVGLQNAIISDFHEITISTLVLMLLFWAIIAKKKKWYFVFLLLTLGFKESIFIAGVGIGLLIIFIRREWYRIGFATILISLVWGFLSIKIIIPYFSDGFYQYLAFFSLEPKEMAAQLFGHQIKRMTIFYSFLSFGFLPLLSPPFWFLIFQDFFTRFAGDAQTRWGLGLHYSSQIAVIFSISSMFTLKFLNKFKTISKYNNYLGILLIFNALILYRFVLHGPLALAYNYDFYKHTGDFNFLDQIIAKIPKDSSVMTQNNLAVRFTHQKVWLLRDDYQNYNADYIVVDTREGQNPNNFFGIKDFPGVIKELRMDKYYLLVYKTNEQFVFKRKK